MALQVENHQEAVIDEQCQDPPVPTILTPLKTNIFHFHPTAFLTHVINSSTGAAIHTLQLVPTSRRGFITGINDMCYAAFIEKVSGRVNAVFPRAMGSSFAERDVMVRVVGEWEWKALLKLWQNARKATCEFVVEGVEVD
ncbi:hypothetical protein EJ02DRAFT_455652, partial [Clathrospora elynae]